MTDSKHQNTTTVVVVVLYHQTPETSSTVQSFYRVAPTLRAHYQLLIVNNSADSDGSGQYEDAVVKNFKANQGLAKAYNLGLGYASQHDLDWLMLFDQDSTFDSEYLQAFETAQQQYQAAPAVAAIVPQVKQGNVALAPSVASPAFSTKVLTAGEYTNITSINSGTMLRVQSMTRVGGFNEAFPLDFLDYWIFWRLRQAQVKTVVLPTTLQHELSVMDLKSMADVRYTSFAAGEQLFYSKYDVTGKRAWHKHKILRIGKLLLTGNFNKAKINLRYW